MYDTIPNTDIIEHFGNLPEQSLRELGRRLGLGMRDSVLAGCAAYYRTQGRDPSVGELRLLDRCIRTCDRAHIVDQPLHSLTCLQPAVADMLAALMQDDAHGTRRKGAPTLRSALSLNARHAPLSEAATGATLTLTTDRDYGMLPAQGRRPCRSLCIGDTGLRLVLTTPARPWNERTPMVGEIISFLPLGTTETEASCLQAFWEDEPTQRALHSLRSVEKGGLLPALLSLGCGCQADLCLPDERFAQDIDRMLNCTEGYLLIAGEQTTRALVARARELGLRLTPFARLTVDGKLTLNEGNNTRLSIPCAALATLCTPPRITLQLHPDPCTTVPPDDRPSRLTSPNGWEAAVTHPAGLPVRIGQAIALHTTLPLHDRLSPADMQAAVMRTVLGLVAAGVDPRTLTATISVSASEQISPCALWSAALGWHHAVKRWSLTTQAPVIETGVCDHPTVTVCLYGPARRMPGRGNTGETAPHELRLFAVQTDQNGLPDEHELSAMLALTADAVPNGHIIGLRPLWGQALGEALASVKDVELNESVRMHCERDTTPLFGLLVRTDGSIPHGVCIGRFTPSTSADPTADSNTSQIAISTPPHVSLVHREHPTVLFPILPATDVPHDVIRHAKAQGADPQTLSVSWTHEGCTALADAIGKADVVVLNGDCPRIDALLAHVRVAHALRCHIREDGSLMALHGAAASEALTALIHEASATDARELDHRVCLLPEGLERPRLEQLIAYYR